MTKGLVYMRPIKLAYVRAVGPYATASLAAWAPVLDWLDRTGLRKEVGHGYGLAHDNPRDVGVNNCRYDAAIELPLGYEGRMTREFALQTLPGGAYIRERNIGEYIALGSAIQRLRDGGIQSTSLLIDKKRPVITIFFDDPQDVDVTKMRADVCLPVTVVSRRSAA